MTQDQRFGVLDPQGGEKLVPFPFYHRLPFFFSSSSITGPILSACFWQLQRYCLLLCQGRDKGSSKSLANVGKSRELERPLVSHHLTNASASEPVRAPLAASIPRDLVNCYCLCCEASLLFLPSSKAISTEKITGVLQFCLLRKYSVIRASLHAHTQLSSAQARAVCLRSSLKQ